MPATPRTQPTTDFQTNALRVLLISLLLNLDRLAALGLCERPALDLPGRRARLDLTEQTSGGDTVRQD
jgi:hypothetical protein